MNPSGRNHTCRKRTGQSFRNGIRLRLLRAVGKLPLPQCVCRQEAVYFEHLIWVTKILILFGQDPSTYPRMYLIGHKLSGGPCPGFVSGESVAPANRDIRKIRDVHSEGEIRLAKSVHPALTLTNAQSGLGY